MWKAFIFSLDLILAHFIVKRTIVAYEYELLVEFKKLKETQEAKIRSKCGIRKKNQFLY